MIVIRNYMEIMISMIIAFYLLPMIFSIFYMIVQRIEDRLRISTNSKAYRSTSHYYICLMLCLIPIVNLYIVILASIIIIRSIRSEVNNMNKLTDDDHTKLINTIEKFGELKYDWNGYGAQPISEKTIRRAIEFAKTIYPVPPLVCPTGRSTIQFEWEKDGLYLEAEVYEDRVELMCCDTLSANRIISTDE